MSTLMNVKLTVADLPTIANEIDIMVFIRSFYKAYTCPDLPMPHGSLK